MDSHKPSEGLISLHRGYGSSTGLGRRVVLLDAKLEKRNGGDDVDSSTGSRKTCIHCGGSLGPAKITGRRSLMQAPVPPVVAPVTPGAYAPSRDTPLLSLLWPTWPTHRFNSTSHPAIRCSGPLPRHEYNTVLPHLRKVFRVGASAADYIPSMFASIS